MSFIVVEHFIRFRLLCSTEFNTVFPLVTPLLLLYSQLSSSWAHIIDVGLTFFKEEGLSPVLNSLCVSACRSLAFSLPLLTVVNVRLGASFQIHHVILFSLLVPNGFKYTDTVAQSSSPNPVFLLLLPLLCIHTN